MNKYWFYKLLFGALRKKYRKLYKQKKILQSSLAKNNFILVKENGDLLRNPSIKGLTVEFCGENSTVEIHEPCIFKNCTLRLSSNDYVKIGSTPFVIMDLETYGRMCDDNQLIIGDNFSCGSCCVCLHDEPKSKVVIGNDCMFSTGIVMRTSDGHAIISESGEYLNQPEDIVIGDHVWLGMGVKVLKGAVIPNNSVVAMSSVFLRNSNPAAILSYTPPHSSIFAGVPAKMVKSGNFRWVRDNCYDHAMGYTIYDQFKTFTKRKELKNKIILARIACLGQFTLQNICIDNAKLVNHQKNRVDYALELHKDIAVKINFDEVKKYIPTENQVRYDGISSLFEQEEQDIFDYANKNVCMLIMDSFSELTDKQFLSIRNKSRFLAHWKDINHTKEFAELYRHDGLIPVDKLYEAYDKFFALFNRIYGQIPIVFLNFPTDLDQREEYKKRGEVIAEVIDTLAANKYPNIIPIKADVVEPDPEDEAVYHFSENTYRFLAKKLGKLELAQIKYMDKNKRKLIRKLKLLGVKLIPFPQLRRSFRKQIKESS